MTTTLSPAKVPPSFAMIDVRCIAPDATQVRRTFDADALAELADSIKQHGIIEPIIVRPGAEADSLLPDITHTLIAGERRWRAAMIAGLTEVPAIIRSDLQGEDLAVVQVLENLQRADLTLPELGNGVAKLVQALGTAKTAAQLGKSEGWVSKHARLEDLPEVITACIDAGTLTSADMAHDLKRMIDLVDTMGGHYNYQRDNMLQGAADGTLTRARLRDFVDNLKTWAEQRDRRAKEQAELEAARQASVDDGDDDGDDDAPQPPRRSPEQLATEARMAAERDAVNQRRHALDIIKPVAFNLRCEIYGQLCAAMGTEPHRYNETGDLAPEEADDCTDPGVFIDLPWPYGDDPIPTEADLHTTQLIALNIPLPLAEARRLIAALLRIRREPTFPEIDFVEEIREMDRRDARQAARLGAILATNPEAAATADADNPPSFVDWCADNLVADPAARTQCVDVYRAYNATQPEKVISGPAARWTMQDNRWAKRADEAGLTKKRFTNGWAYVGVRMVGGEE